MTGWLGRRTDFGRRHRRLNGFLDLRDAAGDALQVLLQRRDAGDQAFAVGDQDPHGVGKAAALECVQRPDRLGS